MNNDEIYRYICDVIRDHEGIIIGSTHIINQSLNYNDGIRHTFDEFISSRIPFYVYTYPSYSSSGNKPRQFFFYHFNENEMFIKIAPFDSESYDVIQDMIDETEYSINQLNMYRLMKSI